jgi:GTP:adenosylcobinamide-phosphate guanylyltransferase
MSKALIDVAGKPMVQWVLDALCESSSIERIVVIGLSSKAQLECSKPLIYMSGQGKLLENLKAGTARVLELDPNARYVLFVSSDIPSVTGEMVDWLVKTCAETDDDLYYNVIRREDMERRFPGSKRTWTHLRGMDVCGGDMNMARAAIVSEHGEFWNKLIEKRKDPLALAEVLGIGVLAKLLTRRLSADDVIKRVANKLGLKGRAIICPYPEIGMDVDKPNQLEIVRADLARRARRAAKAAKPKAAPRAVKKTPARKPAVSRPKAAAVKKTSPSKK